MARFVRGDIVLKHRPALVLALWDHAGGTNYLTCLITTQKAANPYLTVLFHLPSSDSSVRHR